MKKHMYAAVTLLLVLICCACSNDSEREYPGHEELARRVLSYCREHAYSVLETGYEKDLSVSCECTLNVSGKEEAETALRKLAQQINGIADCDFIEMNTDTPSEDYYCHWRKDLQSPILLKTYIGNSVLTVMLTFINGYMIN
ncbi:MAG: hypothetical protein LUF85_02310 [Bacteroides sp.]|nr:hypothetical protein [Bacteroides sp.]